jgi:hypothetical protein
MTHGYARVILISERRKLLKAATAAFQNRRTDILQSLYCLLFFAALINSAWAVDDSWAGTPLVLREAVAWHTGDAIPLEFRQFRESAGDMPEPMDSEILISQLTNLALLVALATDVSADPECREDAFSQGMYVGGPTRFFGLVERDLKSIKERGGDWRAEISRRISQPHVVVDALFVSDKDLSTKETERTPDRVEGDLRVGTPWQTVYEKYADEFRDSDGHRTKIGNLGHLVVFKDPQLGRGHFVDIEPHVIAWEGEELPRRLWRLRFLDASHVVPLTHATSGDIVRLHSIVYHQTVLYQVQEVYSGRVSGFGR